MDYEFFYDIATYGSEHWKGKFTQKEIACNAYDYLCEYRDSKAKGIVTETMYELCKLLVEDMKYYDYEIDEVSVELELGAMEIILQNAKEELI